MRSGCWRQSHLGLDEVSAQYWGAAGISITAPASLGNMDAKPLAPLSVLWRLLGSPPAWPCRVQSCGPSACPSHSLPCSQPSLVPTARRLRVQTP